MKKTLFLFVMLFWVGSTFAQNTTQTPQSAEGEIQYAQGPLDFLEHGMPLPPDFLDMKPLPPIPPMPLGFMPVTQVYDDRAAFEGACGGLVVEDFENGNGGTPTACTNCPISSTMPNGSCYNMGELLPGFEFGDFGQFNPCQLNGAIALWPPGGFGAGNTSFLVLPNFFVQNGRLEFNPGVTAVGFDFDDNVGAIFGLGGLTYQIQVFGAGNVSLGVFPHTAVNGGVNFWGVQADEDIVRIEIVGPGNGLETIDNLTFGSCAIAGGGDCLMNACVTVTCPPDVTVACITDVDLDPDLATAASGCGAILGQWISNAEISGVPGCPGTTYTYLYKAVDDTGEIGCCERIITIDNTDPVLTVPPGATVNCFDEISVNVNDAEVTNTCADWNLYLAAPQVVGPQGCPGTQYIYTYRVVDACGRVVEATQTFTEGANAAPTITAPADVTCTCLGGVTPNPDNAAVTTSCGAGSSVTVTGPQIFGPIDCNGTVYRYTYTVTDDCGRMATDIQDYTVSNGPPVFDGCPGDNWLVLNCEDFGGESGTIDVIEAWIASVTASTSCGLELTVFNNFNPNNINTCVNNGYNTVTFRATDNCGRSSFCTGVYVVVDTEAPTIIEEAQDHWEMCNYNTQANLTAWVQNHGGAVALDGCSTTNISWQASPSNPQINCIGAMGTTSVTVQFIVTDNCGNKTTTEATFNALMGPGNDFAENGGDQINDDKATLLQNRPNPFKDETLISFNLPESTFATLTIFDVNGRTLKVLDGNYEAGYNEVAVSASDLGATGVMYYRLMTDHGAITKTMLVIK